MKKQIILVSLFFIILNLTNVFACVYFPKPGYWVSPGEQKAIIFHEDNTETLILSSGFQGNSRDLAWIIPTPTRPEVTKASENLFTNIDILTRPKYSRNYGIGLTKSFAAESAGATGVRVIESKQVDYYDVSVLLATNSQDLIQWFNINGYTYPEEYAYVLNYYIEKGWYFTTIKVSPEAQGATEVLQDFKEGHTTPIKMEFLSENLIYPLKISSIDFPPNIKEAKDEPVGAIRTIQGKFYTKIGFNQWKGDARYDPSSIYNDDFIDTQPGGAKYNYRVYPGYVPITLYVIADSKYQADGFQTVYANRITDDQIRELGYDGEGEPYINPGEDEYFVTRLNANYQKSQMDEDLILREALDNKKINAGPESWQFFVYGMIAVFLTAIIWLFSPLGILFVAGFLMLVLAKSNNVRTTGKVFSIISMVLTAMAGFGLLLLMALANSLTSYIPITILVTILALDITMLILTVRNWSKD